MISIAIIDIIGLTYDGTTLLKRGLGGSESAVILISQELSNIGFDITVFNNCIDNHCSPGIYDNVKYVDISTANFQEYNFDVVISSRTVQPFIEPKFSNMLSNTKWKILWMHDTFCNGDNLLESMLVNGSIDEIFTLSDFHSIYVSNCDHGGKRMFEVLKNKIYQTRNGVVNYNPDIRIENKDPNLFVYNASVSKGMVPLVNHIWPKIKNLIPEAKLKIIGGFYRFKDNKPDEQELKYWELYNNPNNKDLDIEFTGIIKQEEIAEILTKASFMLYPAAFPETYGISTLESLTYNTPLITTNFGALEETAIDSCCYKIDYPIEPNNLFPNINLDSQVDAFVNLTLKAYNDKYLHQQKMYACNIVKEFTGWDSVAIQWKQHIFSKLEEFLSVEDFKNADNINRKIHKIFGRRFSNTEEWVEAKSEEQRIVIISPFWNASEYIEKCIESVASQNYKNYHHYLIDDNSDDMSYVKAQVFIKKLPENIRGNFSVIHNEENKGAVYNQIKTIIDYCKDSAIIMLLDGDDWLYSRNDIFDFYNNIFLEGYDFSYGSCWSLVDNIPLIAQPYPEDVIRNRSFRDYKFNWNIPYHHFRVFRKYLINDIPLSSFKDSEGKYLRAGGDVALFYNIIEKSKKIKVVQDIIYIYNDKNPLNDYKIHGEEQTKNAKEIMKRKHENKPEIELAINERNKRILIAIPTAKYIEAETFKSIYDLIIPEGYEVNFQYFYGYRIDQVRNLTVEWGKKYDYFFSVDSDIVLPNDCLVKMLSNNYDMVTGMYIQRIPNTHNLEIYKKNSHGGVERIPCVEKNTVLEIDACGFGCFLINSEVLRSMEYPHFVYKSAIDHKDTISEDIYFCNNAKEKGYTIWVDTSIICPHIGSTTFEV